MANDRDARSDLAVWLGEELRRARLAAGYTSQEQFARELGFDRTVNRQGRDRGSAAADDMAASIAEMFPELCNGLYVRLAGIARKSNGPIPGWFAELGRDRGEGDHLALVGAVADPRAPPDRRLCAGGSVDLAQGHR